MKKNLLAVFVGLFLIGSSANAIEFSLGVSANGGAFDATGHEVRTEQGSTLSDKNKSDDLYLLYGSVFGEIHLSDLPLPLPVNARVGISYVPYALESETTESTHRSKTKAQGGTGEADRSQKVQVDLEDLASIYLSFYNDAGFFVKLGAMQGDLVTNESLDSGSSYGNTTLEGVMAGVGLERNLDNGMFVRAEVNYSEYDNVSLEATTASDDSHTNKITVKDLSGFTGALSIGKSF